MVDIIQSTRQMVTEYMASFDSSHDMYHVERVVDLALLLAKETDQGLDKEVVQLAALCHDVGDRKYYQGKETGGSLVESFLKKQEYPKASLVGRIVDHIGFSKELGWDDSKDPEEQVTWRNHCLELHV
ncbi:hypothetical protein BY458DRAFT_524704 [Sporodiniella umbellata]|nr:hypothetical protein BY458DRAFT_524704 [Sporodiniella umbellata]